MMSIDMYRSGQLAEAVESLLMPVQCIEERANAVFRCASAASAIGEMGEKLSADIRRLERALDTLKAVANGIPAGKPALRLVAAE
jgi:hypothetical protein